MHGLHENWLRSVRAAVPALLDYVDARWYCGRAGGPITLDASIPESNPMASGYAHWFGTRWAGGGALRSSAEMLPPTGPVPIPLGRIGRPDRSPQKRAA